VGGVDRDAARALLSAVADGALDVDAALDRLVSQPFDDLGFARVDTHRALRTGDPEVVYGAGKTPEQSAAILASLYAAHPDRPVLLTRVDDAGRAAIRAALTKRRIEPVTEDSEARCLAVGPIPPPAGKVVVVSAGTSDGPVAAEAAFVARAGGAEVERINDVGVAGLHRLLAVRPALAAADCVVVVAGMDGALPSAVGGLIGVPLVAVPTSVGYGAAFGGLAPLLTMLNSCAPGVAVVNIDNGFGAGVFAARVVRRARPDRPANPADLPANPMKGPGSARGHAGGHPDGVADRVGDRP
jgi:NCAIR mutase (PurE)-related protein